MYIVRVVGGIGNQLFIYAFARALSLKLNSPVTLEFRTGFVKDDYRRKYLLDNFNIQLKPCTLYESLFFPLLSRFPTISELMFKDALLIKENNEHLDPIISCKNLINRRIYFTGYWQNSDYFDDISHQLRKEFVLKIPVSDKNKDIASIMQNSSSVAIHIRKKNYQSVLGFDYYSKAISIVNQKVEQPQFFIFSDDIDWCKNKIIIGQPCHYVDNNIHDELQDLWLMSHCKNFIIANSTFSWWAAWLSNSQNKIVIKPSDYLKFNFPTINA